MFRKMLRYEWRVALRSWELYIATALIFLSVSYGVIIKFNDGYEGMNWAVFYMEGTVGLTAVVPLVLPLVCGLSRSMSFVSDIQNGYVRVLLQRCGKFSYCASKIVGTGLISATSTAVALSVALAVCMALFPWSDPSPDRMPLRLFRSLFEANQLAYCILIIANAALFSFSFALLGLAASSIIPRKYVAVIAPFIIVMLMHILLPMLGLNHLTPLALITTEDVYILTTVKDLYPIVLSVIPISVVVYILNFDQKVRI